MAVLGASVALDGFGLYPVLVCAALQVAVLRQRLAKAQNDVSAAASLAVPLRCSRASRGSQSIAATAVWLPLLIGAGLMGAISAFMLQGFRCAAARHRVCAPSQLRASDPPPADTCLAPSACACWAA